MKTIVLGAGIIGISTAWHLLERGHEVIVIDRQPDAALETALFHDGGKAFQGGRIKGAHGLSTRAKKGKSCIALY